MAILHISFMDNNINNLEAFSSTKHILNMEALGTHCELIPRMYTNKKFWYTRKQKTSNHWGCV